MATLANDFAEPVTTRTERPTCATARVAQASISTLTLYLLWHRCRMRSAEQDVVEGVQKRGSF